MASDARTELPVPPPLADLHRAGVAAQREVAGSIAVGGSVCAMYAGHRLSLDVDFVVPDLAVRFDEVREHLLGVSNWTEARVRRPHLILGRFGAVPIGYRQQIRATPIETAVIQGEAGALVAPTLDELIRIKAVLAYQRNAMRDFLDFAELVALAGRDRAIAAVLAIDAKFATEKQPSVALEVAKTLTACQPLDAQEHSYETFKLLSPRLSGWRQVRETCQSIGKALTLKLLESPP